MTLLRPFGKAGWLCCALIAFSSASVAHAQSSTWTTVGGGSWNSTTNWAGGIISDGSGNTADFSTVDLATAATVTLDASRTIRNLTFDDAGVAADVGWSLDTGTAGSVLTLAGVTPTITTTTTATINAVVAGGAGLTKAGASTLTLTAANTFSGTVNVSAGTLQLRNATSGGVGTNNIQLASGTTLQFRNDTDTTYGNSVTFNGNATLDANRVNAGAAVTHILGGVTFVSGVTTATFTNGNSVIAAFEGTGSIANNMNIAMNMAGGGVHFRGSNAIGTAGVGLALGTNTVTIGGSSNGSVQFGHGSGDNQNRVTGAGGFIVNSSNNALLAMFGSNSFSGGITLSAGRLVLGTSSAGATGTNGGFGTGTVTLNGGTIRSTTDGPRTASNAITIGGNVTFGEGTGSNQNLTLSGPITLTGNRTLTFSTAAGTENIFSGTIGQSSPGFSLTKAGTSTLRISSTATSTYTGATNINAGTLIMDGTHAGTIGAYNVAGGATLAGSGSVNGVINVAATAIFSPGDVADRTFQANSSVDLDGILRIELDGGGSGSVDFLDVGTTFDITNGTVDFVTLATLDDPFYVFAEYGSLTGSAFATVTNLPSGYALNYNFGAANQIALVAVPEPSSFLLAALALSGCAAWRWRRRSV